MMRHPHRSIAAVFENEHLAGFLERIPGGSHVFTYDPSYVAHPQRPAISLTMPKRLAPYNHPDLHPFFEGLLAEGPNAVMQRQLFALPRGDDFERLVETCGVDTIGSVTVREIYPFSIPSPAPDVSQYGLG